MQQSTGSAAAASHLSPAYNYTEILRRLNITEEDLDYINNFQTAAGGGVVGNSSDGATSASCSCGPCHCGGLVRRLAASYRLYHGYVALLVCTLGTLMNLLNVAVLTRKELRRAPINRILTGLAAADCLVMLEYVPFAVYEYIVLPERRLFPYGWAVFVLFHMHFSQLLHTISIALTLTLAVWRYIVVRYALTYVSLLRYTYTHYIRAHARLYIIRCDLSCVSVFLHARQTCRRRVAATHFVKSYMYTRARIKF